MAKKKTTEEIPGSSAPTSTPARRRAPARKQATETAATKLAAANETRTTSIAAPQNGNGQPEPTQAQIAEAAYYRHLNRGAGGGDELSDWIEAERELRQRR